MKKTLLCLLAAVLVLVSFNAGVRADDTAAFSDAFLTDGKLPAPGEDYEQILEYDGEHSQVGRMYSTQSDTVLALIHEWDRLGETAFYGEYGFMLSDVRMQHDCRLDDGDWHYTPGWDEGEYDYDVLPDYMCLYPTTPCFFSEKIISQGYNIDLYYMDEDGANWGFFRDVVKQENGGDGKVRYLDLENHTLTFRSRYIIDFYTLDSEGYSEYFKIFSDWGPETSVGKNGSQAEPSAPEKLEAPVLSNFTFADAVIEDGRSWCDWNLLWTISDGVFDAEKYYWISEDAFEPVYIESQFRVNGGEWIDVTVANAATIYGGYRGFTVDDCKEDDTVEFRARFICSPDESKNSEWSNVVSNKAGDFTEIEGAEGTEQKGGTLTEDEPASGAKCRLCGVCPFRPLGVCLFLWVLLILLVAIVLTILILKAQKKKNKDTKKTVKALVIEILLFVIVLAVFIWLIVRK